MILREVTIDEIRAVFHDDEGKIVLTHIEDTPHFRFAKMVLDAFRSGAALNFRTTDYFSLGRKKCRIYPGGWFGAYGDIGLIRRCHEFAATVLSIYEEGGVRNVPTVHKKDGEFFFIHDGHHRLATLAAMGKKEFMVNENDSTLGEFVARENFKDFDDLLRRINNGRMETYQPLPPGFGVGFKLGRRCHGRLKMIEEVVPEGSSVLDIGACLGFFARELAKKGRTVTAIDIDPRYTEAMVILEKHDPSGAAYGTEDFITANREPHDFVLCLAVMHHILKDRPQDAIRAVQELDRMAKKGLVLEMGTDAEDWLKGRDVTRERLEALLNEHTTLKVARNLGKTRWGTRDVMLYTR